MYRLIIGILVVAIGLFPLMVGLYKSVPSKPLGQLPPPENPVVLWIYDVMPVVMPPAESQNWASNIPYAILLLTVAFGLWLIFGDSKKSKQQPWEK